MIEAALRRYLADREIASGQIVHFGWLVFRIAEVGPPPRFESLDFKSVASFTTDLTEAENILRMQLEMLRKHSAAEEPCTLRHDAVVSKSYFPGHPAAFMKRDAGVRERDSGWYVGVSDDELTMHDASSFEVHSLCELSMQDRRMLPFWLMPIGTLVSLSDGEVV